MPAKQFATMSVKALQEDGSFEGVLASYNTVDLGGDKILPGAFTKTMQERGNEIPMLWQHKPDQPIGKLNLVDSPTGLLVKGQLLLDEVPQAKIAYALLKAKVIKGLSIGFDTVKDAVENGVRQLKEVRLWEGSVVTFPMNEACQITSVKKHGPGASETKDDFNTELSEIQLQDAGYQMRYALFNALGSFVWTSGLTKEDKVAAAKDTIDQFAAAYLTYLPQYLDWLASVYGDMEMMGNLQMEEKGMGELLSRGIKGVATLRKLKAGAISINQASLELKEGRKFSADTTKTLKEAHAHVKSLDDIFGSLFDDEADDDPEDSAVDWVDDTSKSTAVPEVKTEPVEDHSAAAEILTGLRSLIPKA
jgi:HK97 family phage prohead protease